MPDFTFPNRRGLVVGTALVALYGLQQESLLAARHSKYENVDDHPVYAECKRLIRELRAGKAATTQFDTIMDLMAHTRQTVRISYEEWESCVPLTLAE